MTYTDDEDVISHSSYRRVLIGYVLSFEGNYGRRSRTGWRLTAKSRERTLDRWHDEAWAAYEARA